jgi:hypothetical protein
VSSTLAERVAALRNELQAMLDISLAELAAALCGHLPPSDVAHSLQQAEDIGAARIAATIKTFEFEERNGTTD